MCAFVLVACCPRSLWPPRDPDSSGLVDVGVWPCVFPGMVCCFAVSKRGMDMCALCFRCCFDLVVFPFGDSGAASHVLAALQNQAVLHGGRGRLRLRRIDCCLSPGPNVSWNGAFSRVLSFLSLCRVGFGGHSLRRCCFLASSP